jgi:hypothetical protein
MAAVGVEQVVMVILTSTTLTALASTELFFIQTLAPVFNVLGNPQRSFMSTSLLKLLSSSVCEDPCLLATQVLRRNRPRVPPTFWTELIRRVLVTGDRSLAAKVARQARMLYPQMKLQALPRLVFPVPIPPTLLRDIRSLVKQQLLQVPVPCQSWEYPVVMDGPNLFWEKTPFAENILAPTQVNLSALGSCSCASAAAGLPRWQGHLITRKWWMLPCCRELADMARTFSLQQRTYPPLQEILKVFQQRLKRFLRDCCVGVGNVPLLISPVMAAVEPRLRQWLATLPPLLQRSTLRRVRKRFWQRGLVMVRIDRNPGRLILLCKEGWVHLQQQAFLASPRYVQLPGWANSQQYCDAVTATFASAVPGASDWCGRANVAGSCPQSYWTIKQKSRIETSGSAGLTVKVRPIVSHACHPLRQGLKRMARVLSILVTEARAMVRVSRPQHVPIWQLHAGTHEWIQHLSRFQQSWGCIEFDVADCFLNTPRTEVLAAVEFWATLLQARSRRQPYFAISKDSKRGDHWGRPACVHYWAIPLQHVLQCCQWELEHNASFEAVTPAGNKVVLQQQLGLPIGGHLSAAMVELVALRQEFQQPWPACLTQLPSARYRDNFFTVIPVEWSSTDIERLAQELSALLLMPVQYERHGQELRCLETRLTWVEGSLSVVLAYRTDVDRQGESGDVTSWPLWTDPRTPSILHGLLSGLAAKLLRYTSPAVHGLPKSIRHAVQFLRQRGYPPRHWMRAFAVALLRYGAPPGCLPRALRKCLPPV